MADKERSPAVLISYPGASGNPEEQEIFVYLRPESNGVLVESTMLKVIQRNPDYKKRLSLVYLANLPGEFILRNHIPEEHYPSRLKFAALGRKLFTPAMRENFSRCFETDFDAAEILGAFEALSVLGMRPKELFDFWAPDRDILVASGQTVKKVGGVYVVNCDIPELIHMRYADQNIAVMVFRTGMNYGEFLEVVRKMEEALLEAKILLPDRPAARIFHYSKGPFEQVLDGQGYLYTKDAVHIPLRELPFPRFLLARGVEFSVLWGLTRNPIIRYTAADGAEYEDSVYNYTREDSYTKAWEKILAIKSQVLLALGKEEQAALDRYVRREYPETAS